MKHIYFILLLTCVNNGYSQFSVSGNVTDTLLASVPGARITLFNADTSFFAENRTNNIGAFNFSGIPSGMYTLGVAKQGMEYQDTLLNVVGNLDNLAFTLKNETHPGSWDIIMTSPEALGGTDLGIMLPDGRIFYCHDTKEPFLFDPHKNDTVSITGYDTIQGCVAPTLLHNGKLIFMGGTDQEIYGPGIKKVKTYDPVSDSWQLLPNMIDYRWYPTLVPFPNGRLLVIGGGGINNPMRVKSSEIYDPFNLTTKQVDDIQLGNEVSPIVLLYTGEVLMTHRPPQLFNIQTEQWNAAADFVQGNRMPNGDHSGHELVLLPESDGRVVAIGHKSFTSNVGNLVEIYDPVKNNWSLGSNFPPVRSRAKTVLLPDKKIMVAGGFKEDMVDASPVNQWGQLYLTDLYDPYLDSWRRLDDLNYPREYHCITMLVPDGRVIAVGGEGKPGNEPTFSVIEAFSPPYLFRGVRPEINKLSTKQFERGGEINFEVQKADSLTSVILISTASITHFMNSGNNRYLELDFEQIGQQVSASIPSDSVKVPYGYYMLFPMVDDIPSIGAMINVSDMRTTSVGGSLNKSTMDISIYPNPSIGNATLEYSLEYQSKVEVGVYNIKGQRVSFYDEGTKREGSHRLVLQTSDIVQGMYVVKIKTEMEENSVRFLIMRNE